MSISAVSFAGKKRTRKLSSASASRAAIGVTAFAVTNASASHALSSCGSSRAVAARRGFVLSALRPDFGIPLRDELELELELRRPG